MRIKQKNVARLASISALGAGALGVAAGTAVAGTIYYNPLSPGTIVGPNDNSFVKVNLPGTNYFVLFRASLTSLWGVGIGGPGVQFRGLGSFLSIVSAGRKWSNALGPVNKGALLIASRGFSYSSTWVPGTTTTGGGKTPGHWTNTTPFSFSGGNPSFSHQYALFRFLDSGNTLYGWLQLSNDVSPNSGPNVTLEGWAYDDGGAQIAAGDTGVPEPSTMALTGLAALALRATGLRRRRAARKPAA